MCVSVIKSKYGDDRRRGNGHRGSSEDFAGLFKSQPKPTHSHRTFQVCSSDEAEVPYVNTEIILCDAAVAD